MVTDGSGGISDRGDRVCKVGSSRTLRKGGLPKILPMLKSPLNTA
jgi:hypothetical protein